MAPRGPLGTLIHPRPRPRSSAPAALSPLLHLAGSPPPAFPACPPVARLCCSALPSGQVALTLHVTPRDGPRPAPPQPHAGTVGPVKAQPCADHPGTSISTALSPAGRPQPGWSWRSPSTLHQGAWHGLGTGRGPRAFLEGGVCARAGHRAAVLHCGCTLLLGVCAQLASDGSNQASIQLAGRTLGLHPLQRV